LFKKLLIAITLFFNYLVAANTNSYGVLGYIQTPSAYTFRESSLSFTLKRGVPDRKFILTLSPFDWLDASVFYADITGEIYPGGFPQSYKDKGFNIKFRIKEEDSLPAIAMGANDIAGTGLFSSEYIVLSKSKGRFTVSAGIGWGKYNDGAIFTNPLGIIDNKFKSRNKGFSFEGGSFEYDNYFSGKNASFFGAIDYIINKDFIFSIEQDPTTLPSRDNYPDSKTNLNFSLQRKFNNYDIKVSFERGDFFGIQFNGFQNFLDFSKNKKITHTSNVNNFKELQRILDLNNIGLKKIDENNSELILQVRQNSYPNQFDVNKKIIEVITKSALANDKDSLIIKHDSFDMEVLKTYHYLNNKQNVRNELYKDEEISKTSFIAIDNFPYVRNSISPKLRLFLGAREGFLYQGIFLEDDLQIIFQEDLIFHGNFKYSLSDNFDGLRYPPLNTYPNQVRSDIKEYLREMDMGIKIGRLEVNKFHSFNRKHFFNLSGGIFEEMFGGIGGEYLYFPEGSIFSIGAEAFFVKKRDYAMQFEFQDYENVLFRINASILEPKNEVLFNLSYGEYLAGDVGFTFSAKRVFDNGVSMGAFFSRTNVSPEQFGEGTFDKGITFRIPFSIFGQESLSDFLYRPLTKDPAALLKRSIDLRENIRRYRVY